jgi:hypothetical protein
MKNLTVLDLTSFTNEDGSSELQQTFQPRVVFHGCKLPSLKKLVLRNNYISSFTGEFAEAFPDLRVLDMSYNRFFKTEFIRTIEFLQELFQILLLQQLHTVDAGHQMTTWNKEAWTTELFTGAMIIPTNRLSSCVANNSLDWRQYRFDTRIVPNRKLCIPVENV